MAPPAAATFPGTGVQGNGLGATMLTQNHWINTLKSGCNFCHQLGNQLTRTLDDVYKGDPSVKTSKAAWDRRLKGGVRGNAMYATLGTMGAPATINALSDWTDRIANGQVPPAPPRPKGVERNVVVTLWDVGDDHSFMHDEIATDKNHPTVNAGGPVYAVSAGHGQLVILNPKENSTVAIGDPDARLRRRGALPVPRTGDAVAPLGQRASVGQPAVQPRRSAQPHDRQQGTGMGDVEDPRQRPAWLVQRCSARQHVRRVVPASKQRPSGVVLRSANGEVAADRDLLQHAPPAVRQRRQRDRLLQRAQWSYVRVDRHEAIRRNARPDEKRSDGRADGRGVVRAGRRYQRRRKNHAAMESAGRTWRVGRSGAL